MAQTCQDKYGTMLRKDDLVAMAVYAKGPTLRLGTIIEVLGQECIVVRSELNQLSRRRPDSVLWVKAQHRSWGQMQRQRKPKS